jgi:hypothetical protein
MQTPVALVDDDLPGAGDLGIGGGDRLDLCTIKQPCAARLVSWPKIASGLSSEVRIVTSSSKFMSEARPASISASSYSGSGHAIRPGVTNARLLR